MRTTAPKSTSPVAIPGLARAATFDLGVPPRRMSLPLAVQVGFGSFNCWFGAVFSLPLALLPHMVHEAGWRAAAGGLFPAIGLTFFFLGARHGLRGLRLLRMGTLAGGTLVERTPTASQVNKQRVWRMKFRFSDVRGRERFAVATTHRIGDLQDEREEPILYDPDPNGHAVLLDDLPGNPRVDGMLLRVQHKRDLIPAVFALAVVGLSLGGFIANAVVSLR